MQNLTTGCFECPDDSACATCGKKLPENPEENSPAFDGYCDIYCQHGAPVADIIMQVPWCCGEKDCDEQWHLASYWTNENIEDCKTGYPYTYDAFTDGDHEILAAEDLPCDIEYREAWRNYAHDVMHAGIDPLANFCVPKVIKTTERYKVYFTRTILGIVLTKVMRGKKWLDVFDLPPQLADFLEPTATHTLSGVLLKITPAEFNDAGFTTGKWVPISITYNKPRNPRTVARETRKAAKKAYLNYAP